VLISDDASPCSFDSVLRGAGTSPRVRVLRHTRNSGIARGLNEGLAAAAAFEAAWLLTVDQDSAIELATLAALVDTAVDVRMDHPNVGVLAPGRIDDAAGTLVVPGTPWQHGLVSAWEVMQSGALWSVPALRAIGGFDASLGMDGVDAGACLSLREAGYLVLVDPTLSIGQQVGDPTRSRTIRILGHTSAHTAHGPGRRTSMIRARIRLFPREWRQSPGNALRTLRRVAVSAGLTVALEPDRWAQAQASMRGVREGLRR
jgi:GT2 family glycosyltransferase